MIRSYFLRIHRILCINQQNDEIIDSVIISCVAKITEHIIETTAC